MTTNDTLATPKLDTLDGLLAAITPAAGPTREILDPATGAVVGLAPVHTSRVTDSSSASKASRPSVCRR